MKKQPMRERPDLQLTVQTTTGPVEIQITAAEAVSLVEYLKGAISGKTAKSPEIQQVLDYLNMATNSRYRIDTGNFIAARLSEGFTVADFQRVIDVKCEHWKNDPMMYKFLRPSTLFRPIHFQEYLNEKMTPYEQR
jgi:uncharacterized phage protein (TIGR02220 family)